ncbi:MAG: Fic family protein [bacterium]
MDIEVLRRSPIGRVLPISDHDALRGPFSYFAYLPNPLPESLPLTGATFSIVADAAMALGRLDMAAANVPNPLLLVRPALRKEAVSTSALEGTYAPLTEVLEGEVVGRAGVSAEAREVINYVEAAERGLQLLGQRPISLNLVAQLQKMLVSGTRGVSYDSGQLRQRLVLIGPEGAPIERARFVPPPPGEDLADGVAAWEKWIHAEAPHLLVRVAVGHYQFEALHPFSDGNGRLGRLLVVLQLIEAGALRYPLLNIAEWLEPRRQEYQDRLLRLSIDGQFDSWVAFLCTGIQEQAEASTKRIERLLGLRESLLSRVRDAGSRGGTAYRVADELIGFPIMDIPWVRTWHDVTYQSARDALERLVAIGILREIRRSGRTRRLFVCDEVLAELDR